jgi:hypothetical protein
MGTKVTFIKNSLGFPENVSTFNSAIEGNIQNIGYNYKQNGNHL